MRRLASTWQWCCNAVGEQRQSHYVSSRNPIGSSSKQGYEWRTCGITTDAYRSLMVLVFMLVMSLPVGVGSATFSSYSSVFSNIASTYTAPFCADFDADGLKDCIIGSQSNDVAYFKNTGTASTFVFPSGDAPTTSNFLNFETSDSISFSQPWCGDLTGDGALDCLIGDETGYVKYKQNMGTASSATFDNAFTDTDYFGKDFGAYATPFCVDLDNDGDYDCLIGDDAGDIYLYINEGTSSAAAWPDDGETSKNGIFSVKSLSCTRIKLGCIDFDHDSDPDCFVACASGEIYYFENTGSPSKYSFGAYDTTYGSSFLADARQFAAPFCTDMNDDGAPDCFVGRNASSVAYAAQTLVPTSTPSLQPTLDPSGLPTQSPTTEPSSEPTLEPSRRPTPLPSIPPTLYPTALPTLTPTLRPTALPTLTPTLRPTALPTLTPTREPTSLPSWAPTLEPTRLPSLEPTLEPTVLPTLEPTLNPSSLPTLEPTRTPTSLPSLAPSSVPSLTPSGSPTLQPTSVPSISPSLQPSSVPSFLPTMLPSSLPTITPSGLPSLEPTAVPSSLPSLEPSLLPSSLPTIVPTGSPSSRPSRAPSLEPTALPTLLPFPRPSSAPSLEPTALPSSQPTLVPSSQPTPVPFPAPTFEPTASPQPTTGDTIRVHVSLELRASTAPSEKQSAALKQTVAAQLGLATSQLRGWAISYTLVRRRLLTGDVIWILSFQATSTTTDSSTSSVDEWAGDISSSLSSTSFVTAVSQNVNSTTVDTASIGADGVSKPPTPAPTPSFCAAGTYAKVQIGIAARYNCTDCPAGSTSVAGSHNCSKCAQGTFTPVEGSTACEACPAGSIVNAAVGATTCTPCDGTKGEYIGTEGSTVCDACAAGSIVNKASNATTCTACVGTDGRYVGTVGKTVCDACAAGSIVDKESAATTCTACVGTDGRYVGTAGKTVCDACAAGSIVDKTSAATTCTACVGTDGRYVGTVGQLVCSSCGLGSYVDAENGATSCTSCAAGKFSAAIGATSCEECGVGTYSYDEGATGCDSCENYNKDEDGGWSLGLEDIDGETCDKRCFYYANTEGNDKCTLCVCSGEKGTKTCAPETGECECTSELYVDTRGVSETQWVDDEKTQIRLFDDGPYEGQMETLDCGDKQQIIQSIGLGYAFFFVFVFFLCPLIFYSGGLAVVSDVWRRDMAVVVHELRLRHSGARALQVRAAREKKNKHQKKYLRTEFERLLRQGAGDPFRLDFEDAFAKDSALGWLSTDPVFCKGMQKEFRGAFETARRLSNRRQGNRTALAGPGIAAPRRPPSRNGRDSSAPRVLKAFDLPGLDFEGFQELISMLAQCEATRRIREEYFSLFTNNKSESWLRSLIRDVDTLQGRSHQRGDTTRKATLPAFTRGESVTKGIGRESLVGERIRKDGRIASEDFLEAKHIDAFDARRKAFKAHVRDRQDAIAEAYHHWSDDDRGEVSGLRAVRHVGLAIFSHELEDLVDEVKRGRGMHIVMKMEDGKLAQKETISKAEFRQLFSLVALNEAKCSWPESKYREEFLKLPQLHGDESRGMVDAKDLGCLLEQVTSTLHVEDHSSSWVDGIRIEEVRLLTEDLEDTARFGFERKSAVLYFDDFLRLMDLYHDISIEDEILQKMRPKGFLLKKELVALVIRFMIIPAVVIMCMVFYFFNMIVDVYLMAQSWYSADALNKRLKSYAAAMAVAVGKLVPSFEVPFGWVAGFLLRILDGIAIPINVSAAGVTCAGMQAPCYLALNVIIIAIVITIMDTSMFTVLRVMPEDYRHPEPWILKRCCRWLSRSHACKIEELAIRGASFGAGRTMKYILQLLIAKTTFYLFVPFWEGPDGDEMFTPACNNAFPTPYEEYAAYGSSAVFWIIFLPTLHLLFNTFVFGIAPVSIDKNYTKTVGKNITQEELEEAVSEHTVRKGGIVQSRIPNSDDPNMVRKTLWQNVSSAKVTEEYKPKHEDLFFHCCRFKLQGTRCSLAGCFCKAWGKDFRIDRENEDNDRFDLFMHDPQFWQKPWKWYAYFLEQATDPNARYLCCNVNIYTVMPRHFIAVHKYGLTMWWKLKNMIKMTLGLWDNGLIQNMEIIERCDNLKLDPDSDDTKHETMISAVGVSHTLIWQIIPRMVVLSKLGEALNEAPLFVFDPTAATAISDGMPETKLLDVEHQRASDGGAPPETVTDEKRPSFIKRTSSRLGFSSSPSSAQPQPPPPPKSGPPPPPPPAVAAVEVDAVEIKRPSFQERTRSLGRFGRTASLSSDDGTIHVTAESFDYGRDHAEAAEQIKPSPKQAEQKSGPRPTLFRPPAPPGLPPGRPPPPSPELPPPLPPSKPGVSDEVISVVAELELEERHANFTDLGDDVEEDSIDALAKNLEMTLPRPLAPPRPPPEDSSTKETKVDFDSDKERNLTDTPTPAAETVESTAISVEAEFVELELAAHNMISTLEFPLLESAKAQKNSPSDEDDLYYSLRVDMPKGSAGGGGMLVWFDSGDQDGSKKTIARAKRGACGPGCCCKVFCTCFIRPGATFDVKNTSRIGVKQGFCGDEGKGFWDGSFVEFIHFDTSSKDIGATTMSLEERYGQGLETLPRYKYDGDRTKFKGIADTRVRFASLPTEREPLFIPAQGCAVRFFRGANRTPDYSPSRFKIQAVHAPARPITFRTSFQRRRRHWIIYATMFVAKCAISFGPKKRWQVYGFFLFLVASCVLGLDYAIHTYVTMARERVNRSLLWDPRAWCSLVSETFWCFRLLFRRSKRRHGEPTNVMAASIEEEPRTFEVRAAAL